MNYTKNYHLPQWVKEDRIMMEDFNQMCADMEAGLTGGRTRQDELDRQELERFCRTSYNHYALVRDMEPKPEQVGVFFKNPADDKKSYSNMFLLEGVCFAGKSNLKLDPAVFNEYYHQLAPLHVVKGDLEGATPLTGTFTVPTAGRIGNFSLFGTCTENVPDTPMHFRFTLTNQDTGLVVRSIDVEIRLPNVSSSFYNRRLDENFFFLGGVNYLLTFQPLDAPSNLDMEIRFNEDCSVDSIYTTGTPSATYTMRQAGGGHGGMAVLRYTATGTGGELTFRWDGVEREAHFARAIAGKNGYVIRELIYLRDDPLPEESTLSLQFECNEGGSFLFYDWGGMFF